MQNKNRQRRMKLDPLYSDKEITVYHGTSLAYANEAVENQSIKPSLNGWDWLGHGVYFWEEHPMRALIYSEDKYGQESAVLHTRIKLGRCLDLTDPTWFPAIIATYEKIERAYGNQGKPLPINDEDRHPLDCAVINLVCEAFNIDTVRSAFAYGNPLFPGSNLKDLTNKQIVVRNDDCIIDRIDIFNERVLYER